MHLQTDRLRVWPLFAHTVVCMALYSICVSHTSIAQGKAPVAAQLVQGVLARSEAVFSGRIEFRQLAFERGEEKPFQIKDEYFYFSGTSWAVFADGSNSPEEVSHRGLYVSHDSVPQPSGRIGHSARATVEEPINSHYPRLPVFAGTFWRRTTRDYVKKNADKAVDKGAANVNGIVTHLLEWTVPKADTYEAFHSVSEMTERGGILRLYIAPQLEYVLPRIEILSNEGKVSVRYNSFDFFETAPGIYFPKRCEWLVYNPSGKHITSAFELKKVEKVNEPIPDEIFKIHLPMGTVVQDGRSGVNSEIFRIKENGVLPVEGLDDVIQTDSQPPPWKKRWFAITVGIAVGLIAVLAILFRRRRKSKGSVPA